MHNPYTIPFRNDSGEIIPPYAVMRPDAVVDRDGQWCISMEKPDATFRRRYYVNGPTAIPIDGYGMCADGSYPCIVRHENTTQVAFGSTSGVAVDSWSLKRGGVGKFTYLGNSGATSGTYAEWIGLYRQDDCNSLIVKTSAITDVGGSDSYDIQDEDGDSGMNITALNLAAAYPLIDTGITCQIDFVANRTYDEQWYLVWAAEIYTP